MLYYNCNRINVLPDQITMSSNKTHHDIFIHSFILETYTIILAKFTRRSFPGANFLDLIEYLVKHFKLY